MNVLFLQWAHLSDSLNGASMYEHNMAKWLQSKGHQVEAMAYNMTNTGGIFDGIPYSPYSHHERLISWADAIITTPGKVRKPIPLKEVFYIQHNQNEEPWSMEHGTVIYCANHVRNKINYKCKKDYVLWPFNRYEDSDPLPPCPKGKVTIINCNANKGGRFLGELAKQLPEVEFLGIHSGYKPQIVCNEPNIEYRSGELDLKQVLKDTSLFIMPSEKEGLPTIALEAQSLGVPLLMNDIPAANELRAVKATFSRFAGAIKSILNNYEDSREYSLNLAEENKYIHKWQLNAFDFFD